MFMCSESLVWSCTSWALSRGAMLKREPVSGDLVVAIKVATRAMGQQHGV